MDWDPPPQLSDKISLCRVPGHHASAQLPQPAALYLGAGGGMTLSPPPPRRQTWAARGSLGGAWRARLHPGGGWPRPSGRPAPPTAAAQPSEEGEARLRSCW